MNKVHPQLYNLLSNKCCISINLPNGEWMLTQITHLIIKIKEE